ncbi:MAG: porin family protein [Rhizobiaceae bacterium]|nr:porin family protein [Rhizobiaceae bacterium]
MKFTNHVASLLLAAAIPFAPAFAADYDPPVVIDDAPEMVPVEVGSGWYLRGDLGYVISSKMDNPVYRIIDPASGTYSLSGFQGEMDNPFTFGAGFGYHFNDLLRADLTVDGMRSGFDGRGASGSPCSGGLHGTGCRSESDSEMSAVSFMANGYVDLGTIAGLTPYVGAGAGYTYVSWDSLDTNYYCTGACGGVGLVGQTQNGGTTDWRFTWQAMAGVAYAINSNLKLDLGYRYRQISEGDMFKWNAAEQALGATGNKGIDGDLSQHEIRIGLRYDLW